MLITSEYHLTIQQLAAINYQLVKRKRLLSIMHMMLDPMCILFLFIYLTTHWLSWPLDGQKLLSVTIAITWLGFSPQLIQGLFKLKFHYLFKTKIMFLSLRCDQDQICTTIKGQQESCFQWTDLKTCFESFDAYLLISHHHLALIPFQALSIGEKQWLEQQITAYQTIQSHLGYFLSSEDSSKAI